jgi:hypothetical protein
VLVLFLATLICGSATAQTTLMNGASQSGTLSANTTNAYTFTANASDNFVLRLGTVGFDGRLDLYGPTGAFLKTAGSGTDAVLAYTATNSGTFTVLVSSYFSGGAGTYVLHLAQFPEPFIVPPGEQGGPMTNGGNYPGTNSLGDQDMWSFTANAGDNFVLRLGTVGFDGNLNLYGPNGAFLKTAGSGTDAVLAYTATNSGTFTVLVSSYFSAGVGTYVLHLAQFPEPFIVPPGEQGGPMTNGGNYPGTNSLGGQDMWSFTANAGDNVVLRLGTVGFDGNLNLYGPNGAFLKTAASGTDAVLAYTATNSGTFTVLVSSYFSAGVGTYVLHLAQFPEPFSVPPGEQGGPMANGGSYAGTNSLGDQDMWSFTANGGDNVVLRLGTVGFDGNLNLYGPTGAFLKTAASGTDAVLAYTATNSGTFTVLVSSYFSAGVGTYVLHLAQFPEPFGVPPGEQGGPLTNGGSYAGTISLGDQDMWSFTANAGDNVVLRLGAVGFDGNLNLYGPNGAFLKTAVSGTDAELAYTATNSGTFTVLVSSYFSGGVGTYVLHLAQFPEPFIVPPGEQGGPLTNGGSYAGTISLGDQHMWSFTANARDSLVVRLGAVGFDGNLNLYGPNGAFLKTAVSGTDAELAYSATNSGTFTVLVSSYFSGGVGTYVLRLAQFPEPFIVPPGEQGGPMIGSANYFGTITLGGLEMWAFTACAGDPIYLVLNPTNFTGNLNLYGPNGALLRTATSATAAGIAYTATNSGTFTVLVSSYFSAGTGTYQLNVNGLSDGLKLCFPVVSGTNGNLGGVGGVPSGTFVLFTETNASVPFGLWPAIRTNQFDSLGGFSYTNLFNPAEPQRYFRLRTP